VEKEGWATTMSGECVPDESRRDTTVQRERPANTIAIGWWSLRMVAACASVAVCLTLVSAAASGATTKFGGPGEGPGQFFEPAGLAVEQDSGDIYVVDSNHQRVEKFDAEGAFLLGWGFGVENGEDKLQTCTTACRGGFEGLASEMEGSGQLDFPQGVAVDNSVGLSHGDVYVIDVRNNRVEKYGPEGEFILAFGGEVDKTTKADVCTAASGDACGAGVEGAAAGEFESFGERDIAVDAEGHVYVGDGNGVQRFSEGGIYEAGGLGPTSEVAVAGPGKLYTRYLSSEGVREYEVSVSGGELLGTELSAARDAGGTPRAIAVGPAGELFVMDQPSFSGVEHVQHILEYDAGGDQVEAFAGGEEDGNKGLAWGETAERLYALNFHSGPERGSVRVVALPSPGPLLFAGSQTAAPVDVDGATVHATVNPEGAETTYHFDYGTEIVNETATPAATLPGGFEDEPVDAPLEGLAPGTTYHFHVAAENANGSTEGPDQTFTTPAAVAISEESVTEVTDVAATIEARVNPSGVPATYRFQYWTGAYDPATAQSTPTTSLAGGSEGLAVSASLQGLTANTEYHWRLVAEDERGGVAYTVDGQEESFTTQAVREPLTLLDGRAWELVSPANKRAGALEPWSDEGGVVQAAASGDAITYISRAATEAEPEGEPSPDWSQILSSHSEGGWGSRDIATRHEQEFGLTSGDLAEYRLFSPDLSFSLVEPRGNTPLSTSASERTPYMRRQALCEAAATAPECFLPMLTEADVASGVQFGGVPSEQFGPVQIDAAAPDLRHVVLESSVPLLSGDTGGGLYEWSAGAGGGVGSLQLASVLPGGAQAGCATLGYNAGPKGPGSARAAISADGDLVFWEGGPTCASSERHLYVSYTGGGSTMTAQLDVVQPGATGGGGNKPVFQLASGDGEHVFFTDSQSLTKGASGDSLYECTLTVQAGQPACALSDLTEPVNAGEAANVQGLIAGASEDGSYVYLVARGVLSSAPSGSGESASAGAENFYELHLEAAGWQPTFIATLAGEDANDWAQPIGGQIELDLLSARVSPNGRWLAFMSQRPLTGYDNRDLSPEAHGARDQEVFLYAADDHRLACVSCDPSGARPHGVFDPEREPGLLVDRAIPHNVWGGHWLAGSLPNWTKLSLNTSRYQPRYLLDSGRVFFDSADALVPQDVNGVEDVYEYEPPGVGNCTADAATYARSSGGCVGLVSSGESGEESAFLDASQSGNDVFFLTAAKLTAQDSDTAFDVYDAHVCGSGWACAVPPYASQPSCESASSCKAAASGAAGPLGAAATLTPSGAGNLVPSTPHKKQQTKQAPLNGKQKLRRALKACKASYPHNRHKRRACKRRARRRIAHSAAHRNRAARHRRNGHRKRKAGGRSKGKAAAHRGGRR
jgi:DNA-binding beta-propeller fold protein YncE